MLYYGFILPDGTELEMTEDIRLHYDLALKYIKDNNYIRDFRKSSCEDPVDFMVVELGTIKIGNFARATSLTVAVPYFSDFVKEKVEEYGRKGYQIDCFFRKDF